MGKIKTIKITKKSLAKQYRKLSTSAWKVWSDYRRRLASDDDGFVYCFTCDKKIRWKRDDSKNEKDKYDFANLGHFIHGKLDYDSMNTQIQCTRCNRLLHGNLGVYCIRLITMYGLKAVKDMIRRSEQHTGYTAFDLQKIITTYQRV